MWVVALDRTLQLLPVCLLWVYFNQVGLDSMTLFQTKYSRFPLIKTAIAIILGTFINHLRFIAPLALWSFKFYFFHMSMIVNFEGYCLMQWYGLIASWTENGELFLHCSCSTFCLLCFSSALDTDKNIKVAIKKLTRPFQSAIHARRTFREIKMLKHMNHENVSRNDWGYLYSYTMSLRDSWPLCTHVCRWYCSTYTTSRTPGKAHTKWYAFRSGNIRLVTHSPKAAFVTRHC